MRRISILILLAASAFAQSLSFIDRYSSTLSGSYTSGGSSLSVTSATGLPSGSSLYYVIVKAEGANTEEVFKVTSRSGTTLTVTGAQAGTSASNHASGATIIGSIMTADAFQKTAALSPANCAAASSSATTYTCSTATTFTPAAGDSVMFKADVANSGAATLNVNSAGAKSIKKFGGTTDPGPNDLLAGQWVMLTYDGTNWQMNAQPGIVYPPDFSTWTQINFGGCSGDSTYGPLYIKSADNVEAMIARSQPSTPYTIDYVLDVVLLDTSVVFVGWRESATSKVTIFGVKSTGDYNCQNNTSNTTFNSFGCGTGNVNGHGAWARRHYFRLQNTGTVLRVYVSPDGQHWNQYGSDVNVNTFFTTAPDQEVFAIYATSPVAIVSSASMISRYVH